MKKYRYRFKGKFSDGTRKIVLEVLENGKVITSNSIPHPKKMWTQKNKKNLKGKSDTFSRALCEPFVNDRKDKFKLIKELKK
ncbi:MAG: hypothetical protein KJ566_00915 [Nanoarchaeota archaeon]|nr:hypothetical protein [Nanoarchaeota archaeon]